MRPVRPERERCACSSPRLSPREGAAEHQPPAQNPFWHVPPHAAQLPFAHGSWQRPLGLATCGAAQGGGDGSTHFNLVAGGGGGGGGVVAALGVVVAALGVVPAVFVGAGVVASPHVLNLRAGLSRSSMRSGPHAGRCFGQSVSALQGVTQKKRVAADPWMSRSPGLHDPAAGLTFTQTSGPFGVVEPVHDWPEGHCPRPCPQTCRHFCDSTPPGTSVSLTESCPGLHPLGSRFGSAEGSGFALAASTASAEGVPTGAAPPASTPASVSPSDPSFGQPTRSEAASNATQSAEFFMSGRPNRVTRSPDVSTFRRAERSGPLRARSDRWGRVARIAARIVTPVLGSKAAAACD